MRSKDVCAGIAAAMLLAAPLAVAASATSSAIAIPVCQPLTRSLAIGARGSDVTVLQQFLKAQGYLDASATGYFGILTRRAIGAWQVANDITTTGAAGWGIFGPLSRSAYGRTCTPGTPSTGSDATTTPSGQRIQAPGTVTMQTGGIAEIRNENYYFTLTNLTATSATIELTPVGCWNWFPSDTPRQIVCLIAVMPIAPITLSVGQTASGTRPIMLTQIVGANATFSIGTSLSE